MRMHAIIEGRLYQSGRLAGDEPALAAAGITLVVSMWGPELRQAPGIRYLHRPIGDGKRIDPVLLDFISEQVADELGTPGGRVLVHCHAGRNRSGLVTALAARRVLGISGREALALVRERRPNAVANEAFATYLEGLPKP